MNWIKLGEGCNCVCVCGPLSLFWLFFFFFFLNFDWCSVNLIKLGEERNCVWPVKFVGSSSSSTPFFLFRLVFLLGNRDRNWRSRRIDKSQRHTVHTQTHTQGYFPRLYRGIFTSLFVLRLFFGYRLETGMTMSYKDMCCVWVWVCRCVYLEGHKMTMILIKWSVATAFLRNLGQINWINLITLSLITDDRAWIEDVMGLVVAVGK